MLYVAAVVSLISGLLSVVLCPIPILGILFGLSAIAGGFAVIRFAGDRRNLAFAAMIAIATGLGGSLESANQSIRAVSHYRARQADLSE
jgi:hypothetical protein